jgi:hypothetical protein
MRPADAPRQSNVSRTPTSIGSPANLAIWVARGLLSGASRRTGITRTALPSPLRAGLAADPLRADSPPAAAVRGWLTTALAVAMLAAVPASQAQDAPVAGQSAAAPAPGATASQTPSAAPAPAGASSSANTGSPAPPTTGQVAPASQSSTSKSDPVCFKLTGHCVDSSKAPPKAAAAGSAKGGSTGKKPLNLTAPDVRTVVPESELQEPLPGTEQITETQEADTVSVNTEQGVPPDVPVGFGAIWWAVNHPSQAWRIVTPAE